MARAWARRLSQFEAAGWQVHVATVLEHRDFAETPQAWRDRGWLAAETQIHHYRLRDRRLRSEWHRPTDRHFARDQRVSSWLDWLVGMLPGAVVFADSPVTYAPVALMRNPHVAKVMTLHLSHRPSVDGRAVPAQPPMASGGPWSPPPAHQPKSYKGIPGQPKLAQRFLPFAGAADVIVVPTALQAKHLREDLPSLDVRHIPNIVEPSDVEGVPRDPMLVVTLGRLDPIKRIDHVIRAVGILRRDLPDIRLAVYGRGPDLARLQALTDKLGLRASVSFPGYVEDAYRVLAGAGLSVMASRREAFGLAVAESLAAGTPVVSYDIDYGPSELVSDGLNGRLVPSGSVVGLAQAIGDVQRDEAGRTRMSEAALRSVEQLHPGIVGAQWLHLAGELGGRAPGIEVLLEDVVVRAEDLHLVGVAHGASPLRSSVHLGGSAGAGPAGDRRPGRTLPREIDLRVPLSALVGSEVGSVLTMTTRDGRDIPVVPANLPTTLVPTPTGPLLLGALQGRVVRLDDPATPVVRISRSRVCWSQEALATDLTGAVRVSAGLVNGHEVRIRVDQPGLKVKFSSRLVITDAVPVAERRVLGTLVVTTGGWVDGHWACAGEVAWDVDALAALVQGDPDPVALRLCLERRGASPGRITVAARRPLTITGQPGCLLVRGRSGHALLVTSRGLPSRLLWMLRQARV